MGDFYDGHTLSADRNPMETFDFGNVKQYWGVGHMKEIHHFYSCLERGEEPQNSVSKVMGIQEIVCGIYESGRMKRRVEL